MKRSNNAKIKIVLQHEIAECGLACIAMVSSFYGRQVNLPALREKYNISSRGMNLKDMVTVFNNLRMDTIAFRISIEELGKVRVPAVLHWDSDHFVVLTSVGFDKSGMIKDLVIVDPGYGERKIGIIEMQSHFDGVVLEIEPSPTFQQGDYRKPESLGLILDSIKSRKNILIFTLLLSLLIEVLGIVPPLFMQVMIDKVMPDKKLVEIPLFLLLFSCVMVVQKAVLWCRNSLVNRVRYSLSSELLSNVTLHLIRLPLLFFERRSLGEISSKILALDSIENSVSVKLIIAIVDLIFSIILLAVIFSYDALLSCLVISFLFVYFLVKYKFAPKYIALNERKIRSHQREIDHFTETIFCIQTVKLFNKQFDHYEKYLSLLKKRKQDEHAIDNFKSNLTVLEEIWRGVENLIISSIGCLIVLNGDLTLGALFSFLAFKLSFTARAYAIGETFYESRTFISHLLRLSDLTSQSTEKLESVPNETFAEKIGKLKKGDPFIELNNVSYQYSDNDDYVLDQINLVIYFGENIVITGESGSGKTTLLKLLLGIMKPTSGNIMICGMNLDESVLFEYRKNIASVMQNDTLLSGSLQDNIAFFDSAIDLENVKVAAKKAAVLDEINRMPMRLKTYINAFNPSISGGQIQRVLLARAFYKQPILMFLDEASSHLDAENERTINKIMREIDITRIAVAHRIETIQNASRQITLSKGMVVND